MWYPATQSLLMMFLLQLSVRKANMPMSQGTHHSLHPKAQPAATQAWHQEEGKVAPLSLFWSKCFKIHVNEI